MSVSGEMASMLSTCAVCRGWAEQDEGPYHRDAQPERRDVVEDRDGARAAARHPPHPRRRLASRATATVEIWQCDALGRYSGFPPPNLRPSSSAEHGTAWLVPAGPDVPARPPTHRRRRHGRVPHDLPGWYPGRTVHIHLMVHADGAVLTSQLYFPDDVSDEVFASAPYAERPGRDTTNDHRRDLPDRRRPGGARHRART